MLAAPPDRLASSNVTAVRTPEVAVAFQLPAVLFAVTVTLAKPAASVVACVAESVPEAPLFGLLNATVTPGTGLSAASVTSTISGELNAPPSGAWFTSGALPPCTYSNLAAGPTLVSVNDAVWTMPLADATTVYLPAVPLAVSVTRATPKPSVTAVGLRVVVEAPAPGAVNVTVTPGNALPAASVTSAASCLAKPLPVPASCLSPSYT